MWVVLVACEPMTWAERGSRASEGRARGIEDRSKVRYSEWMGGLALALWPGRFSAQKKHTAMTRRVLPQGSQPASTLAETPLGRIAAATKRQPSCFFACFFQILPDTILPKGTVRYREAAHGTTSQRFLDFLDFFSADVSRVACACFCLRLADAA